MEYTTTIVTSKKSGELQEVSGVYIGETQDGKPAALSVIWKE